MKTVPLSSALVLILFSVPTWASDLKAPGVPHFFHVTGSVYRGAQPTAEGFMSLSKLGIKTIIDLRPESEHSCAMEAQAVEAAGMRYISLPMRGFSAPSNERIARILAIFDSREPVFIHCRRGKDRTGTVIACYRIARDGWDNQKALSEARSLGMAWYEVAMKRYILNFKPKPSIQLAAVDVIASGGIR